MELAETLMRDFKRDFPERYSLKEEFELMLADLEKKELRRI